MFEQKMGDHGKPSNNDACPATWARGYRLGGWRQAVWPDRTAWRLQNPVEKKIGKNYSFLALFLWVKREKESTPCVCVPVVSPHNIRGGPEFLHLFWGFSPLFCSFSPAGTREDTPYLMAATLFHLILDICDGCRSFPTTSDKTFAAAERPSTEKKNSIAATDWFLFLKSHLPNKNDLNLTRIDANAVDFDCILTVTVGRHSRRFFVALRLVFPRHWELDGSSIYGALVLRLLVSLSLILFLVFLLLVLLPKFSKSTDELIETSSIFCGQTLVSALPTRRRRRTKPRKKPRRG